MRRRSRDRRRRGYRGKKRLEADSRRRFAIKLANQLGRLDVDAMLHEMTPEQFRERYAHYMIEQWGDDWTQAGTIAATVQNAAATIIKIKTGAEVEFADPADFKPQYTNEPEKPRERGLSDDESFEQMRASL